MAAAGSSDASLDLKEQGNAFFKAGKYAEACEKYTAAIESDAEDAALHSNRSFARLKMGDAAAAAGDARTALALRPKWGKAHFRLGCALEEQGHLDAALEAFRCGLDLEPESKELADRIKQLRKRILAASGSASRPGAPHAVRDEPRWHATHAAAAAPAAGGLAAPDSWAAGLPEQKRYEWLVDCYRMRVDDNYALGGGDIQCGCLYDLNCTPESIAGDFLVFCKLAVAHGVVPASDWSWPTFLQTAAGLLGYAFEKSDAQEKYGSENVFAALTGGRSLRHTAEVVMGGSSSCVYGDDDCEEAADLYDTVMDRMQFWLGQGSGEEGEALFAEVGGRPAWRQLAANMQLHRHHVY